MSTPQAVPAEVRAALGVSETELPDSVINLSNYTLFVTLDLEDTNAGIPAMLTTVSALPEVSRSADQQRFYDLVHLFSSYSRAQTLLTSLPMFSVRRLTDGRAEFERAALNLEELKSVITGTFNIIRSKMSAAFVKLSPSDVAYAVATFSMSSSVGIGTDPVTNA